MPPIARTDRRTFLKSAGASALTAGAALAAGGLSAVPRQLRGAPADGKIALGFDNFSIRALGWKAPALLDYAASLGADTILFSDLDVYESHDADYLKGIRDQADRLGLRIHAGTGSICPTSGTFRDKWGDADAHLALVLRVAAALGSPVARCYIGNGSDRLKDGGIARHIESTAAVCKRARSRATDAGVKIAVENHAGDTQGREIAMLIEEAGPDFVGATMDSGNAVWALEDPMENLEALGRYAVTTGIRDSAVWENEDGSLSVQWTNMGQGQVDWDAYMKRYRELCPEVPVQLEIISGGPRRFDYLDPDYWKAWPDSRGETLARFIAMAKKGRPYEQPADRPEGDAQLQQKYDLERSLEYCRTELGLGV